ncbi:MAG: threonine-phosphate decarboxylase [Nitrospirae bacterium]|nr:threonine-phosphate decarboxylase [Nitrospirota bacterium]
MTEHGGNIYLTAQEIGMPEEKIIDFSAPINPLGVPKSAISEIKNTAKYLFNYPDPDATELRQHISKYHGINSEFIICGNGSTELIYLIVRTLKPKKVLMPQPTFSEYERACKINSKFKIQNLKLGKENSFDIETESFIKFMKNCEMAFLCNPNNPTGRLVKRTDVLKIAGAAKRLKCYLVVDEAFIDFVPEESVIREVEKNPYLIVLRSMTKFYALSGLRIGYGVFHENLVQKIKGYKEPWAVNSLAQTAGIAAFKDAAFKKKTFRVIKQEKDFLEKEFKKLGISYIPSEVNYYLLRLSHTKEIVSALRNKGILVRDCSNFKGLDNSYMRIAVRSRRENEVLIKELSKFLDVIPAKAGIQKTNKLDSASSAE